MVDYNDAVVMMIYTSHGFTFSAKPLLTHQQLETHGSVLSNAAIDALVPKHQAISNHNADWIFIVLDQFRVEILWV